MRPWDHCAPSKDDVSVQVCVREGYAALAKEVQGLKEGMIEKETAIMAQMQELKHELVEGAEAEPNRANE